MNNKSQATAALCEEARQAIYL